MIEKKWCAMSFSFEASAKDILTMIDDESKGVILLGLGRFLMPHMSDGRFNIGGLRLTLGELPKFPNDIH